MANEMKELHGAVFELTPDMISAVSLDEIEVEDMTPKTRNVKDDTSDKRHRVDDERFGGTVYKLPGLAVRDCRRKRIPMPSTILASPSLPTAWKSSLLASAQEGTPMSDGIYIPWWGWLALIAALLVCAIVIKFIRDMHAMKTIIAARTKHIQQVEDEDRNLVRYGKRLGGHYIAWPRAWCNQEEASERGALTVSELWPDETAEPIARRGYNWVQRTKRL